MKIQPINILLAGINLVLLVFLVSRLGPSMFQENIPTLRGRAFQLVDEQGAVRASIKVEPGGEAVLRLFDQKGVLRIKLGTSTEGSGLVLLNSDTNLGVQILANSSGSSITLKNKDGQEEVIGP